MSNKQLSVIIIVAATVLFMLIYAVLNADNKQKDRASWCVEQGGVPVMNSGFVQLCLQPEAVIRKF